MQRIIIVSAAIIPPLLVLAYGIAKGRGSWRARFVWTAFFAGAASAIAALGCEFLLLQLLPSGRMSVLGEAVASAIFVVAIPEEAIKFFVLLWLSARHADCRRMQDIVVLAVAVSLGFAALENLLCVIAIEDSATVWLRAITSVPEHGISGLMMGALLTAARLSSGRRFLLTALAVPIALHAAYDLPLFAMEKQIAPMWFAAGWVVVVTLSSGLAIVLCNRALVKAAAADRRSGRDASSVETTDWLIVGGLVALTAGPLLAAVTFYVQGVGPALAGPALSIVPVALGIDAIRTGLRRRKARNRVQSATPGTVPAFDPTRIAPVT
jgi:protease PrsW